MADHNKWWTVLYATGVNLNTVGNVGSFVVPFGRWTLRYATFTNASTSLGSTLATIGVSTGSNGTGNVLVTAATGNLTPLTTAAKIKDGTIASTDAQTGNNLYLYTGVAHGSAATCDVVIVLERLP